MACLDERRRQLFAFDLRQWVLSLLRLLRLLSDAGRPGAMQRLRLLRLLLARKRAVAVLEPCWRAGSDAGARRLRG